MNAVPTTQRLGSQQKIFYEKFFVSDSIQFVPTAVLTAILAVVSTAHFNSVPDDREKS